MQIITVQDLLSGEGFLSCTGRDAVKALGFPGSRFLIMLRYNDYGGSFFDRVALEFFQKKTSDIYVEDTAYSGKNAVVYDYQWSQTLAEDSDPRHFIHVLHDFEELYNLKEDEAFAADCKDFIDTESRFSLDIPDKVAATKALLEAFKGYFRVLPSGSMDSSWNLYTKHLIKQELAFLREEI